jgi:hypothetical protein
MLVDAKYVQYLVGKKIEKVYCDEEREETILYFTDGSVLKFTQFVYKDYA